MTTLTSAIKTFLNIPSRLKGMFYDSKVVKFMKENLILVKWIIISQINFCKNIYKEGFKIESLLMSIMLVISYTFIPMLIVSWEIALWGLIPYFCIYGYMFWYTLKNPTAYQNIVNESFKDFGSYC